MSCEEYLDLFFKAQKKDCPFVAFVFDMVDNKKYTPTVRYRLQETLKHTIKDMTKQILLLEKNTGKEILCRNKFVYYKNLPNKRGDLQNCTLTIGDVFHFYVNSGSIDEKTIKKIFMISAKNTNKFAKYHFSSVKFETFDYSKGNSQLFAGY